MAGTYTTTILAPTTPWKTGETYTVKAKTVVSGTITNTDTFTIEDILPPGQKTVVSVRHYGGEYDTNASPTTTITIGDGTDADGWLTSKTAGVTATGISQIILEGDGVLIGTAVDDTDLVVTLGGTVATAGTPTVFTEVTYVCGNLS